MTSYVPESDANYFYSWEDFTAADPSPAVFNSGRLTDFGSNAAIPYVYGSQGGYAVVDLRLAPNAQHIFLSAQAPTIGTVHPDFQPPNNALTGQANAGVHYKYLDYAPVTVNHPVNALISYHLDINGFSAPVQANYDVESGAYSSSGQFTGFAGFSGGIAGDNVFRPTGSVEVTLMPDSTLGLQLTLDASAASQASTLGSYPNALGPTAILDLSHTGILDVQELDANGAPIPGNPDLQFVSGVQFGAPAVPPPADSVPEPQSLLLFALAVPIALLFHHRGRAGAMLR